MWKHKKRGTTYDILAHGILQMSDKQYDMMEVVVYECLETGQVWVRPETEFYDGRFEHLSEVDG